MSYHIYIEIKGKIDTLLLWSMIEHLKLNLMALDDITYIYGNIALHNVGELVSRCALFGNLEIKLSKGGEADEQEKKES